MIYSTLLGHLEVYLNQTELNIGETWRQNNIHYFKRWLTIFLYSLKTFKLVNLVVGKILGYFSLMSAGVWIYMVRQVTISSTTSTSVRSGTILSKTSYLYTIEKPHVHSLSYQKIPMELSTLFTTTFSSPSVMQISIGTLTPKK